MEKKQKWWGYYHINGSIQVKRFFEQTDITEAQESDFVDYTKGPFLALNREEALKLME